MFTIEWLIYSSLFAVISCWDVAVTTRDGVDYFSRNGTLVDSDNFHPRSLSAITYDAAKDRLFVVDERDPAYSIFFIRPKSERGTSEKGASPLEPVVKKQKVRSLAYDPVTTTLLWLTEDGIKSMNLSDPKRNQNGEVVVNSTKESLIADIAVDSCGGFMIWAELSIINMVDSKIKRAKLDGSEVEVIIGSGLSGPSSPVVDLTTRQLFWADTLPSGTYIESSDYEGRNRTLIAQGQKHQPTFIAVDEFNVYWVDNVHKIIFRAPKNTSSEPIMFINRQFSKPVGLAVKYSLSSIDNNSHCQRLISPAKISEAVSVPQKTIGENYISSTEPSQHPKLAPVIDTSKEIPQEHPTLATVTDSTINDFQQHQTFVSETDSTLQKQSSAPATLSSTETLQKHPTLPSVIVSSTETLQKLHPSTMNRADMLETDRDFFEGLPCSEDDAKDYIIMALGGFCGALCIAVFVLTMKIIQLKKRPRIKKRIIVNKNVTPLTARPEQQCEITIENCCNMNICETVNRIEEWNN